MPNRLLREGVCASESINELTSEEEVLLYRLLVVSDDYGHMDGRGAMLKAQCFPIKDSATVARIGTWVEGLIRKSMLAQYEVAGKKYLAVLRWEARVRTKAKYPMPSVADEARIAAICAQSADRLPQDEDDLPPGLGLGLGLGAANQNQVLFDAPTGRFAVPGNLSERWEAAFPAVSLDAEMAKAAAWLIANPKNAKSNYARFLTNWLTKAQDKAPRVAGAAVRSFEGVV